MKPLGMAIEIELGVTGGEEDGVDNSGVEMINYIHNRNMLPMLILSSAKLAGCSV